jgi:hypothetical protein
VRWGTGEALEAAGWFHTKKEKYVSLDFSCRTIDFDPSPNLSPTGREALKLFLCLYETTLGEALEAGGEKEISVFMAILA